MSNLDFIVVIPARFASTRLPGKPLRLIAGEPMVAHVARRALAAGAREVILATDDPRIADAVQHYPVKICMTSRDHPSGTDRLAECAAQFGWDDRQIIVNLQGDEPFAPPEGIRAVAQCLSDSGVEMATLAAAFEDCETLFDPNAVKVVRDANGLALYFSRAPIPWHRERFTRDRISALDTGALRHIGIYAYRARFLREFAAMPAGNLEKQESLEQLRVLEAGFRIAVGLTPVPFPPGVDTEQDLQLAESRARERQ